LSAKHSPIELFPRCIKESPVDPDGFSGHGVCHQSYDSADAAMPTDRMGKRQAADIKSAFAAKVFLG